MNPMKIEIQHIPSQGAELAYRKSAKEFAVLKEMMEQGECGPFDPLDIQLGVKAEGDLIVVQGVLTTGVVLTCSRCVESFKLPLQRRFTLRFSREIPDDLTAGTDQDVELTADRIGLIYFKGETIDLKDAIQEQVVISLPFKPLCREACKGLCARCGADLNRGPCPCGPDDPSHPFSVLQNLKWS